MELRQGNQLIGTIDSLDDLRVGADKPAFIFKGDEVVSPNPIKDGLVLWYDFKAMSNDYDNRGIAKDLSGNGNDGTLQNFNYTAESGYQDGGLKFDGVDDEVIMPQPYERYQLKEMTISWIGFIRPENPKSSISHFLRGGYTLGWSLGYHGGVDRLMYTIRESGRSGGYFFRYIDRPEYNVPFNFTVTLSDIDKIVKVYLNGILERESVVLGEVDYPSGTSQVRIDNSILQNSYGVKIYNRPLTPEEIQHNYQIEKARFNLGGDDL